MALYAIFLRGVMPTGKNKVPMGSLREILSRAGLEQVRTYIQSGNVIARTRLSKRSLEKLVHDQIQEHFGGDLTVLAYTQAELEGIHESRPFPEVDPGQLYCTFLSQELPRAKIKALMAQTCPPDRFVVKPNVIYHHCTTRYSESKTHEAWSERQLGFRTTTRIGRTVVKMLELLASEG